MLKTLMHSAVMASVCLAAVAAAQGDSRLPAPVAASDAGSRIRLQQLRPVQIENLAVTGKVWGFLKYHHPAVTGGQPSWDDDLLQILPDVLAATDRAAADAVLHRWITSLGPLADCQPCVRMEPRDFQLLPDLAWLQDTRLNAALRSDLDNVYRHRSGNQFYVALAPHIDNPLFDNEPAYKALTFPDAGYQLLGLFRFWNIVQYWAPYRDQTGADWNAVLEDSIASVALAQDRPAYELAMLTVIARLHDTHANLWSSLEMRPPAGPCKLPVRLRFIEGQATILGLTDGASSALQPGDVVEAFDGVTIARLVDAWRPYYADSNEPARLRDMVETMTRGACASVQVQVRRDDGAYTFAIPRVARTRRWTAVTHDRPGATFQMLTDDVAYIKLSSIKRADIPGYMERAAHTKGLIVDIRNYPSEFVPFALGQYFIDKPTPFARFTNGDLANPGGFKWGQGAALQPQAARYTGKVMILVDETAQSQSEYTAMALRAGPRAQVVGSTTAGADGNVSPIPLPGGLQTMISGLGVFYPDKRPTQRIGIVPDIVVTPTRAGLRAGRDEVLDAAMREIARD